MELCVRLGVPRILETQEHASAFLRNPPPTRLPAVPSQEHAKT